MKRVKKITKSLSVILFSILILICLVSNGMGMGKQPQLHVVKFGVIIPLTGPLASLGQFMKDGLELAAEEVNSRSSDTGLKIEIVYGDNMGTPKDSVSLINKQIAIDKIKFFLVSPTPACMAVAPIVDQAKVLMFAGSTHPYITDKSDYIFRTCASSAEENDILKKYAQAKGFHTVGALYVEDDFGQSALQYFENMFLGKVAAKEPYSLSTKDFRNHLIKIKQADPQAVLLEGYGVAYPSLLKQMVEMNIDVPIMSVLGMANPPAQSALASLPPDFVSRIVFTCPVMSEKFSELVKTRFSRNPNMNMAFPYDFVKIVSEQIIKNGDNVEKVAKSILHQKHFSGAFKSITFLANGDARSVVELMKMENGQIVPLIY